MAKHEPDEMKGCAWIILAFFGGIALMILASKINL